MIRFFFTFSLIITILLNQSARADWIENDSCTGGMPLLNTIVANITTLGLFTAYSGSFKISGAEGENDNCDADVYPGLTSGNVVRHNSRTCKSGESAEECDPDPDKACSNKGGMRMGYMYIDWDLSEKWDWNWVNADGWGPKFYVLPIGTLKAMKNGDKICAYFDTTIGYQPIGCKYIPDCDKFSLDIPCYVAQACTDNGYSESRSFFPLSSIIIQCISESVDRLFVDTEACGEDGSYTVNYFPVFQDTMRNIVRIALTLYLVLFGIKISLGRDMPSKGEFFTLGARYVLVLYFSVGISMGTIDPDTGEGVYDDGVTTYMLPFFKDGSSDLAGMVYSAGGAEGLCVYDEADYNPGYGYMSMWDSIDCRLLYYLGFNLSSLIPMIDNNETISYKDFLDPIIFTLIIPSLFSMQIVFMSFMIVFALFLFSAVVYLVHVTVVSLILIGILVYLAPIFIPFALFESTKSFYESWLKVLASYSLQPMIVAAYIAMMLTIFDQTMFGDCLFEKRSMNYDMGGSVKEIPIFVICDPDNPAAGCKTDVTQVENVTKCKETVGYYINPVKAGQDNYTDTLVALFFDMIVLNNSVVNNMLYGMVTLTLFAYLFYKFGSMLAELAADLSGGVKMPGGGPMAMVDKAKHLAMAAIKAKMGDKKGAAESLAKAATSEESVNKAKGRAQGAMNMLGKMGGSGTGVSIGNIGGK